jgi:peptide/nickel transport system permease protein
MSRFVASRLLQAIPVIILASILVFLLIKMVPGDPARVILGENARPEEYVYLRAKLGLDQPLYIQYGRWLLQVLQGDLGQSQINKFPVGRMLILKGQASLELALGAMFVATILSFPIGIMAAVKRGSIVDRVTTVMTSVFYAVPTFWLGILLVLFISLRLKWLPPSGRVAPGDDFGQFLRLLVLPSITLGIPTSAVLARFIKMSLLEVMQQDYIRTARAKGLRERAVLVGHALRNSLIPVVTVFGLQLGHFLGGAVVTESIFMWPGLGSMALHGINQRDFPVVQGVVLFVVVVFVFMNLLVDLTYGFLDPRVRYE